MNFYVFACKLNSNLIDKGYKLEVGNNKRYYLLNGRPFFFIDYVNQYISYRSNYFSTTWGNMDWTGFYDKPNFDLVNDSSNNIIKEYKNQLYTEKIERIKNDFV